MSRLQQLETFLQQNPNDSFLMYALALEHIKHFNDEKAYEMFSLLKSNNPKYVATYYHLGKLLERLKRFDDALETYLYGSKIALEQNDHHARNELMGAYNMLNDEINY